MRERGVISIDLILYVTAFLAAAGVVAYLIHLGGSHEREKQTKVTMAAKLDRQIDLTNLGNALSKSDGKLAADRVQTATAIKEKESTYAPNLRNYIPKSALGKSCLSAGFVRYTDSAAAGVSLAPGPVPGPASPAGAAGDDPADTDEQDEGSMIARNYWRYHICERRVQDLLTERDATRKEFNEAVAKINSNVKR